MSHVYLVDRPPGRVLPLSGCLKQWLDGYENHMIRLFHIIS